MSRHRGRPGWNRPLLVVAVASAGLLTACPGQSTARDKNDSSPPSITLTVTASASAGQAGGVAEVAPGTTVTLTAPGGSVLIKASDDQGVAWVELWMTTAKNCSGTVQGPGLAGAPAKRVTGTVTDTSAPSSLTAGVDINLLSLAHGCQYRFAVWGKAANAATNAVTAQSAAATLVLNI